MLTLKVKIRKEIGTKEARGLRKAGGLPAILYGHGIKNTNLVVDSKEFGKVFGKIGKSSLLKLEIEKEGGKGEETMVLIKDATLDPVTDELRHIDFYQPRLDEEVETEVPLVFEGIAPAVKELGGILVRDFSELEISALPQDLPSEIKVNVGGLKTFEDAILVKDLVLPKGVKVRRNLEDMVASVSAPAKEEIVEKKVEEVVAAGEATKEAPAAKEEKQD